MRLSFMFALFALATCLPTLLSATENAALVKVLVLDSFGKPSIGCKVERFELEHEPFNPAPADTRDLSSRFGNGLKAVDIPFGEYWVVLTCKDGSRGSRQVDIARRETLIMIPSTRRVGDSHRGEGTTLTLRLSNIPADSSADELWIRAISPFDLVDETAPVSEVGREALFYSVRPGTYWIYVFRGGSMLCSTKFNVSGLGIHLNLDDMSNCKVKSSPVGGAK